MPARNCTLSFDEARSVLSYCPDSGVLTWRRTVSSKAMKGTEAGSIERRGSRLYRRITYKGNHYYAHGIAWLLMTGEWPCDGIDHGDSDGLNNRRGNLREATPSQNSANSRTHLKSVTGLKGAIPFRGKFCSTITKDGRAHWLGVFKTAKEAHKAYSDAAKALFGEFARTG